jgi:hypothetical protein
MAVVDVLAMSGFDSRSSGLRQVLARVSDTDYQGALLDCPPGAGDNRDMRRDAGTRDE